MTSFYFRFLFLVSFVCLGASAAPVPSPVGPKAGACPGRTAAEEEKKLTVGYLAIGPGLCTGTLLSSHVVITAAHCVERRAVADIAFTLASDIVDRRRTPFAPAAEIRIFPGFLKGKSGEYGGGDLALVRLSSTAYGTLPRVFYEPGDDGGELASGATAYLVGYGINRDSPGGVRRSRHVRFSERQPAQLASLSTVKGGVFKFLRGDEGEIPCGGDSGSPVLKFIGTRTTLVAVHSASAVMGYRYRDGQWLQQSPQHVCKISFETYATALGPFLGWIDENRVAMETDAPRCR